MRLLGFKNDTTKTTLVSLDPTTFWSEVKCARHCATRPTLSTRLSFFFITLFFIHLNKAHWHNWIFHNILYRDHTICAIFSDIIVNIYRRNLPESRAAASFCAQAISNRSATAKLEVRRGFGRQDSCSITATANTPNDTVIHAHSTESPRLFVNEYHMQLEKKKQQQLSYRTTLVRVSTDTGSSHAATTIFNSSTAGSTELIISRL